MKITDEVRKTLKCADTEGSFELYVTRTPGYLWALFFKALRVHPIAVTLISYLFGIAAGVCFYFDDMRATLLGICLFLLGNWLDCADGQLARMTGKCTLIGRILDGFGGDVWFFFIYSAIASRLMMQPMPFLDYSWGIVIWLLAVWAGVHCHAKQCAVGDYYRNAHMWMVLGKGRHEMDSFQDINARYHGLRWASSHWFEKLYLFFYRYYTRGQERQAPTFPIFKQMVEERWGDEVPQRLRDDFRAKSLPLMPTTNLLNSDFRVGVLFFSLLIGQPWIYPLVESTLMEWWRYQMRRTHEAFCQEFIDNLSSYQ